MSGTSHDGIDAAVIEFAPDGDGLTARTLFHDSTPYAPELRARLVAALPPSPTTLDEITRLDALIGRAFADVAAAAIARVGGVDLIVSHGQTVYHWVEPDTGAARGTLQLGQPAWIAETTGVPVVSDVRSRDIAAGGQGAPLVGLLDGLVLAGRAGTPAALNLGGISNITVVAEGADAVRAWDIGPANALIDAVVQQRGAHPAGYDADGRIAASGRVDEALLRVLLDEPYYRLRPPKSTGKELFHPEYIAAAQRRAGTALSTRDLVATLTELTVRTVADAAREAGVTELFVSGGGAHNPVIMDGLARALAPVPVRRTDELGLGGDEKEALLMALVGWCTWHGLPASLPSATGARAPRVLGSITPGAGPLRLPEPRAMPRFLRTAR
ncbi:anhydro-N-acetylmuramic acid kinase [Microbacterium sediminis]|nr:anhydro-N-acetylmuramic acid kinase [Microbacterium sediminis]